jgi:acetyl-CoA/propionyl-CoA carboxylase, biotin carboxylase, biotin carboxyl carrier protein
VVLTGHAIEVRINAEEPALNFVPTPGLIDRLVPPLGPWVRLDTGAESGYEVPRDYDSMIGKLIVWAQDRDAARARMAARSTSWSSTASRPRSVPPAGDEKRAVRRRRALDRVGRERVGPVGRCSPRVRPATATASRTVPSREVTVEVGNRRLRSRCSASSPRCPPAAHRRTPVATRRKRGSSGGGASRGVERGPRRPDAGHGHQVRRQEGALVAAGDLVVVLEAMKMENNITAHRDGVVSNINYAAGDVVESGTVLAHIEDTADDE